MDNEQKISIDKVLPCKVYETCGPYHRRIYSLDFNASHCIKAVTNVEEAQLWRSVKSFFSTVFLPHGYPHSVSKDYLQYQIWDSIQAFASSIIGSLSTHAILISIGVGDKDATPLSATITWLLKDGTSMLGKILFAWMKGTQLDSECKQWRFFADILNDIALFVDLVSVYFQNYAMALICISGVFKAIVGVAGGATRAALTQHQARENNMADVSAKDSSQETCVNLLGLLCSLLIIPVVGGNAKLTWLLYVLLTILHLFANYHAVRSVIMDTFNRGRFKIYAMYCMDDNVKGKPLSVEEVNKRESFFSSDDVAINLGVSFEHFVEGKDASDVQRLSNLYENCDYMLSFSRIRGEKFAGVANIILTPKANVNTQFEAMYQCYVLISHCKTSFQSGKEFSEQDSERFSRYFARNNFSTFIATAKMRGFNVDDAFFDAGLWRVSW